MKIKWYEWIAIIAAIFIVWQFAVILMQSSSTESYTPSGGSFEGLPPEYYGGG